jgi:transposase
LVYCVLDIVDSLDLSAIEGPLRERDARGEKGYHPAMMTALLLYGYATGVASSRRLERASYEDVAVRVLTGGQHPDHTRISEFRRENL